MLHVHKGFEEPGYFMTKMNWSDAYKHIKSLCPNRTSLNESGYFMTKMDLQEVYKHIKSLWIIYSVSRIHMLHVQSGFVRANENWSDEIPANIFNSLWRIYQTSLPKLLKCIICQ